MPNWETIIPRCDFQVGDNVRCINDEECGASLVHGGIYVVKNIYTDSDDESIMVDLLDTNELLEGFFAHRFELTAEKLKAISPFQTWEKGIKL